MFLNPTREHNRDGGRFTEAECRYNVRLTEAKEKRDAELEAKGTPIRNGWAQLLSILS